MNTLDSDPPFCVIPITRGKWAGYSVQREYFDFGLGPNSDMDRNFGLGVQELSS